jgi:hypothetical protein
VWTGRRERAAARRSIDLDVADFETSTPMTWLFELSAACVLVALALPFAWKLLPPKLVLRPIRVRARAPLPPIDHDPIV